jgi:hypothetical protein
LCEMTSAFIIKELRGARALRLFCGRSSFPPPFIATRCYGYEKYSSLQRVFLCWPLFGHFFGHNDGQLLARLPFSVKEGCYVRLLKFGKQILRTESTGNLSYWFQFQMYTSAKRGGNIDQSV